MIEEYSHEDDVFTHAVLCERAGLSSRPSLYCLAKCQMIAEELLKDVKKRRSGDAVYRVIELTEPIVLKVRVQQSYVTEG